jgi:hypothetical protein
MSFRSYIAKPISFVFHPLLLPSYAVLLLFLFPTYLSNYQYEYKKIILLMIFIMTFILPTLVLMIMLNIRVINSLTLHERKERVYPYALSTMIYIGAYYISMNFSVSVPAYITNFLLTSAIIVFAVMMINFKYKISAHMAGIGGFISFFYVFIIKENLRDFLFPFEIINFNTVLFLSLLLLFAGLIGSSRLSLGAHKGAQILLGFLTGLLLGFINFLF